MIVLRFCRSPADVQHARELQDVIVTLAAFGMPLTLVFTGPAVALLDRRGHYETELLAMLPGMGVDKVLLEVGDGDRPALLPDDSVLPFETVDRDRVRELLASARHTVNL